MSFIGGSVVNSSAPPIRLKPWSSVGDSRRRAPCLGALQRLTLGYRGRLALDRKAPARQGLRHLGYLRRALVQCANLFCTYPALAASAAFARVTLARMSDARAVQMNGLGSML